MKESKESRTWNHHWLNERGGCKPHGSDALQKGTWQMQLLERQPHLFFCFCFFCCVRRCCDKCNCWDDSPIMKYYRWDCCDMNRWDMKILQMGLSWHESIFSWIYGTRIMTWFMSWIDGTWIIDITTDWYYYRWDCHDSCHEKMGRESWHE